MPNLSDRIREATNLLAGYIHVNLTDDRDRALVHILSESLDLASGVLKCANADLSTAAHVLDRALFERFLYAAWVVQSESNAARYCKAAYEELARSLRKLLDAGQWEVRRTSTGEDVTELLLKDPKMQNLQRPPTFLSMARETGLEPAYTHFYGIMSMFSHGNTFGLAPAPIAGDVKMLRSSASALLACVNLFCRGWLAERRQTANAEIHAILGV